MDGRQSRDLLYQSSQMQQQQRPPHMQRMTSRPGPRPVGGPPLTSNNNYFPQQQQEEGGAYRRNTVSRSRSLSRPERQRPKQGMFRTPSQQRRMIGSGRPGPAGSTMMHHYQRPRMNPNQPMSSRLQQQLQQQKLQQQHEALLSQSPPGGGNGPPNGGGMDPRQQKMLPQPEEEEKPKVLTNWWSWMAFLATCCIPNWFMRMCLRMPNPLTQQAWREKVRE
jgi:chitin synthase